ncbi:MAG TPA: low molecular weight protein-tyrosine-phosphatase [Polyangia bacterium]
MSPQKRIAISFVCMGNICRSPTAEAIMRHLVQQAGLDSAIDIDSAGTGSWHVGEAADERTRRVGERRGIPLSGTARQWSRADFARFDYVLAIDRDILDELALLAPTPEMREKIHLLRQFDPASPPKSDVPDPYYGQPDGFEEVFDLCEAACRGLLDYLRRTHGL